jgi:hypothetical protein
MTAFIRSIGREQTSDAIERAKAHSAMLKRAFHFSLWRRNDTKSWELVEEAVAGVLEAIQKCGARDFIEADASLQSRAIAQIKAACPHSNRWVEYRRAVKGVYTSAALWGQALEAAERAYWRHCALVWLTMWHLADVPQISADQVVAQLDVGLAPIAALSPRSSSNGRPASGVALGDKGTDEGLSTV